MFYGHPVERLCTYQYSLVSLIPGTCACCLMTFVVRRWLAGTDLLQTLDDCGSPPLAARAPSLSRPTSLRTSDRKSMMAYLGLPLDVFGKVQALPFCDIYIKTEIVVCFIHDPVRLRSRARENRTRSFSRICRCSKWT
jgi:hypothetical protein